MGCNKGHCKWFVKNSRWKSLRRSDYLGQLALSRSEVNEAQHSNSLRRKGHFFEANFGFNFWAWRFHFLMVEAKNGFKFEAKNGFKFEAVFGVKIWFFCHFFRWAGASSEPLSKMPSLPGCCGIYHGKVCLSSWPRPNCNMETWVLLQHGVATRKVAWHCGGTSIRLPNCIGFLKPKVVQS